MAPEGEVVAAAPVVAAADAEPAPVVAPAAPVVAAQKQDSKVEAVVVAKAEPVLAAKAAEPVAKAEPAIDPMAALQAQLAETQKQLNEIKANSEADRVKLATERMDLALERAGILPAYRDFARAQLKDVDASTDAGKAKVDEFAQQHVAMTSKAQAYIDPQTAWIDSVKKDAKPNTLVGVIPRAFLANAMTNAVSGGES